MSVAAPRAKILVVDDRAGNLLSLKGILERPDYEVLLAQSGEEALKLVLLHEIAVILLDIAMPQMDGFEVAELVKKREPFKLIPIIFVTASVQQVDWIFRAYNVGAVDLLHKPLDPHAVRAKVGVFVELYWQRKKIEEQALLLRQSEDRRRELELEQVKIENERRYRNLAEAIPQIVWTAGPEGDLEYVNARWEDSTGQKDSEAIGNGWRRMPHPEDSERVAAQWAEAVALGNAFEASCRLRAQDGSYRWFLCRGLPERDSGLEVSRWLGTFTDVDVQARAHEETLTAVRLRDEFLSIAAHELKTPLTSLALQLEGLLRGLRPGESAPLPTSQVTTKISKAIRQTERLGRLVKSLLDVSRIVTGKLELEPEAFDLSEMAREVVDRFRTDAEQAGSELRLHIRGSAMGHWDRLRMEQVLSNLLSNALKYAPQHPIDISVGLGGRGAQLVVRDGGMGIPAEQQERIFERFERAVSSRHYGGLGLGLYIVREIVRAHRGDVALESRPGDGATFTVEVPLATQRPAAADTPEPALH